MTKKKKIEKKLRQIDAIQKRCRSLEKENKRLRDRVNELNAYTRSEMLDIGV